jgi:hypothetical protein
MRHLLFVVGPLLVAFAVVAGQGAPAAVFAQVGTATPTAGFIGLPEGISAWRVSEFTQAPSLYRFQFEPDAKLPGYADETLVLAYVERGTVTLRSDGHLSISRLESSDPPRIIDPGAETVVAEGEYFVMPWRTPTEIWNHSEEIAWIQFAMMNPTDPVIVDPNEPLG